MAEPARFTFLAAYGTPLTGTLYAPEAPRGAAVLMAGAPGVAHRHCAPFGGWLADRGHRVMSFDQRAAWAPRGNPSIGSRYEASMPTC